MNNNFNKGKARQMKCNECLTDISKEKWGCVGMVPDQKIYVKKCPSCGHVVREYDALLVAVEENREQLMFNQEVHHVWPDSIDLLHNMGFQRHLVRNALLRQDLD